MSVAEERIRAVEARISRNAFETAVVFDKDGNVVFEKTGDEDEVKFTREDLSKFKGHIFTHNHAYNEVSEDVDGANTSAFSSDDLMLAYQHGLQEVRMVIGSETHSFIWNDPKEREAHLFLYEMDRMEYEANLFVNAAAEKANTATFEFQRNPNLNNEVVMDSAVAEFFKELKTQNDKMNDYILNNQHIGYTFRRECVL
jgi:hypothetical protein